MDLPSLARDLDKLATADAVVADSYVRYVLKKGVLYFLACLLALLGLSLLGLALYWLLEQSLGPIGATALVGVIGCLLASIVAVIALLQRPGREFSLAMDLRKSTIAALEKDIEISRASASPYIYPAGEALITSVLLPLVSALIRSLRPSHSKAAEMPAQLTEVSEATTTVTPPKA